MMTKRYLSATSAIVAAMFSIISCSSGDSEYDVAHRGRETVSITAFKTLERVDFDAAQTSLSGCWLMVRDSLYFFDDHIAGVKEYDVNGQFVNEHIAHGRGPGEMLDPAWSTCFNRSDSTFVILDSGFGDIHRFTMDYRRISEEPSPFFYLGGGNFQEVSVDWNYLQNHPDSERLEIYEYNSDCRRMACAGDTLVMPAVSDHPLFNKYYKSSNSVKYYRTAHTFVISQGDSESKLIGHYPPVYRNGNLAIFSEYDFVLQGDNLYVSFAADSNIYRMSLEGAVLDSFGFPEIGIGGRYPGTDTFEEYEDNYRTARKEYGFYGRIAVIGNFLFRVCKLDGNDGFVLQIYDVESLDLIGRIHTDEYVEPVGFYDGFYYAFSKEDLDKEVFRFYRFAI